MTLALLLRFWREIAIGALVVALIGSCVSRDHRIGRTAVAQERGRQADSVLRVVTPQFVVHDTAVVHDTVRVRVAMARVVTVRDTLLRHLTDTLLVKEYVSRTDSVMQACSELSNDCAAFRASATQMIAAWKAKAEAAPLIVPKSCVTSNVLSAAIGAGAGWLAHRHR